MSFLVFKISNHANYYFAFQGSKWVLTFLFLGKQEKYLKFVDFLFCDQFSKVLLNKISLAMQSQIKSIWYVSMKKERKQVLGHM